MNLFDIPIVATAISLVIAWALFSILCSLVQEVIAQIKAERGRFMKQYLMRQLLDVPNDVNWAALLYVHGSIDLLTRAANKPTSDIAPCLFAETLIDVVGSSHIVQRQAAEVSAMVTYTHPVLRDFKAATLVLQPSDVATMMKQAITAAELATPGGSDSEVYNALVRYLETWYGEMIQRLNLWYKKKVRRWLFVIGVTLGVVLNIDSIQLFRHFNANPASRTAMMQYYEENKVELETYAATHTGGSAQEATQKAQDFSRRMDSLRSAAVLPLGFDELKKSIRDQRGDSSGFTAWMLKIIGILMTGLAATVGAPFWFEVLRKAYSVRKK